MPHDGYGDADRERTKTTADAFLNWVWDTNTDGRIGFTHDAQGEQWRAFMNSNMGMWMRNSILNNLPQDQQIALYQREGYLPQDYGQSVISQGGGYIRVYDAQSGRLEATSGIGTRVGEEYPVFARYVDTANFGQPTSFIVTYRNGQIVEIGEILFNGSTIPSDIPVTPPSDVQFTFDAATPLNGTAWAESLFE